MEPIDTQRLGEAITFAARHHGDQTRKGGDVTYLCHLLAVSALVIEHSGDSDQAVAGVLHDVLEDCADVDAAALQDAFGERVAGMVKDCTDTQEGESPDAKAPWRERKERFLEQLSGVPNESMLVIACDKRQNLDSLVGELRAQGLGFLSRFKGTARQQVWYYEEVLRRVVGRVPLRLQLDLENLIAQLRMLIQAGDTEVYDRNRVEES